MTDHVSRMRAMQLAAQLQHAGRLEEAQDVYRGLLQTLPEDAEAYFYLANLLKARGKITDAFAAYRAAIGINPAYFEAHYNLGNTLKSHGKIDEAIASYQHVLQLKPDLAAAHNNLGNALMERGRLDEAEASYRHAVRLKPDNAEAFANLGVTLDTLGHLEEAIACYRESLRLKPGNAEAFNNLGVALEARSQVDEAIACFRQAQALRPDFADPWNNLGNALKGRGELEEAMAAYRRALALKPGYAEAHSNLLMALQYPDGMDSRTIHAESQIWNRRHAEPLRILTHPRDHDRTPDRVLRIGYVSPDFRAHSVAYFIDAVLARHDRSKVNVFCYSPVLRGDAVTNRFIAYGWTWRSIAGLKDHEVADIIRIDTIDILVDLAGHTSGGSLLVFARKPAPVQVTWIGYPDITGVTAIDYRLTDALADPPAVTGQPALLGEALFRLPETFLCFQSLSDAPLPLSARRANAKAITFGSFNNRAKITPQIIALWCEILHQTPASRLLLKNAAMSDRTARDHLTRAFTDAGIAPSRLDFRGRTPTREAHLAAYADVDIALDTFPYHGTTTTCEALWMGAPVVTLAGSRHASRVGVSLLTNAGFPEWIAESPQHYVRLAVDLARDAMRLEHLSATVRDRMLSSPLMDAPGFVRHLEAAYRRMWKTACAG